ncbi:uncharacterized protein C8Q71DRAFT_841354 [Rhodofomes roseus]|uniref:Uncharacterized protein n=1 Tax=Rhodofomes roseus TaxID=34475 RepID=A0ABQ8K4U1_9APHY|nr:uncharacterized protein C8Q71DRAFT_841354 [Rhodofomes roseus]KAH9831641.1 hypothetical protein C8Q71DRAFT_841354 [Rhodofomes roseus]
MTNRPRNSVLYMFDPLESMTTPRRDGSPDSGSSDKENDIQPGEVTVFFNRIYTTQMNTAPKNPNGKLIDIGDTTTDDVFGEETVDCMTASPADTSSAARTPDGHPTKRTPLGDIEIEEVPMSAGAAASPPDPTNPVFDEEDDATPLRVVTAAPTGAPLADVINSINLSAMTISGSAPPSPLANRSPLPPLREDSDEDGTDEEGELRPNCGEVEDTVSIPLMITVSSPTSTYEESNSLTDWVLPPSSESPTDRLFASSTVAPLPPTRRPLVKNRIPNDDPRRASVDLQASFNMQMQSAEMSFDLLNDKISFQAGDSMWAGGDDEEEPFDMAAEMMKMEAAANEYERIEHDKEEVVASAAAPSVLYTGQNEGTQPSGDAQVLIDTGIAQLDITDMPEVPASQPVIETPPKVFNATPSSTSSKSEQSSGTERRQYLKMLTGSPTLAPTSREQSPPPAAVAPAPVPALRIVKKTWKVHGRTDSGTSAGSSTSTASSSSSSGTRSTSPASSNPIDSAPRASNKDEKLAALTAEPVRPRTVIRGVQRPPAGAELTSAGVVVPAPGSTRPAVAPAKSRASIAREASARFAAAGVQRPNLQQGQRAPQVPVQKAPPAAAASRAQRPIAGTTSTTSRSASLGRLAGAGLALKIVGSTSGSLRAPSTSGIPASKSSSALPRPASRLPAPSAGVKSRDAKIPAPGARTASTGIRRAF